MLKPWMPVVALLLSLSGQALAHPTVVVTTGRPGFVPPPPPPRPVVVVQPVRPSYGHYWVDGQWAWNGCRYVWAPGYWATTAPVYAAPAQPYVVQRPVVVNRPVVVVNRPVVPSRTYVVRR